MGQIDKEKHTYDFVLTFNNTEEFFQYVKLQGYSPGHINKTVQYYSNHFKGKTFNSPTELQEYIQGKRGIAHLNNTFRVYMQFCEKHEILPQVVIDKYRKFIKIKHSQPDVFVPSDKEVIDNYNLIKNHPALELVYLVLMTSGIRYVECIDFLKNYDLSKFKVHSSFVSYSVANLRHTKNINNIYLPLFVYNKLNHITNTGSSLRVRLVKKGCTITLKYLRKWNYNFLIYNGVPESVADFMQGRSGKSIGANHYLAKSQQAEFWYGKVVEKLEKIFIE